MRSCRLLDCLLTVLLLMNAPAKAAEIGQERNKYSGPRNS